MWPPVINNDIPPSSSGFRNFGSGFNPLIANYITNLLSSRREWLRGQNPDPRRDIDDECGYPKTVRDPYLFQNLYDREPIAARVVEIFPRESWQVQPSVYEDEDPEISTDFEKAWLNLPRQLSPNSYYQDEHGSPIWEYLRRVDEQSGIGHYGVLLIGIDDGRSLDQPATFYNRTRTATPPRKLLYLRVFPETLAEITQFETNPLNPRFGQPVMYNLTFNDPRDSNQRGVGLVSSTQNVHWTRVVHYADSGYQSTSSEIFAPPRMRPVLNRLLDLQKLYGGSAEMYWRGALPGWAFISQPSLAGEVTIDVPTTRDEMEQYFNGLQRHLMMVGMEPRSMAPQVVDPTPQIMVQLQAICVKLGVSLRVFLGSTLGDRGAAQNDEDWNDELRARQSGYLSPKVISPTVDRFIALGVLPIPNKPYRIGWPDIQSQTDREKAEVAMIRTQALVQYSQSPAVQYVSPNDYLTDFQGIDERRVVSMLEKAVKYLEDKATSPPPPIPGITIPHPEAGPLGGGGAGTIGRTNKPKPILPIGKSKPEKSGISNEDDDQDGYNSIIVDNYHNNHKHS